LSQKFETELEYEVNVPLDKGNLHLKMKIPPSTLTVDEVKKIVLELTGKLLEAQ